ncbi:unnamed protein product [Amoebophrya sp. A25]|nr:unnamed protein product [Amoebophrya sp. A25]|eukprot:GSA25T00009845001.1
MLSPRSSTPSSVVAVLACCCFLNLSHRCVSALRYHGETKRGVIEQQVQVHDSFVGRRDHAREKIVVEQRKDENEGASTKRINYDGSREDAVLSADVLWRSILDRPNRKALSQHQNKTSSDEKAVGLSTVVGKNGHGSSKIRELMLRVYYGANSGTARSTSYMTADECARAVDDLVLASRHEEQENFGVGTLLSRRQAAQELCRVDGKNEQEDPTTSGSELHQHLAFLSEDTFSRHYYTWRHRETLYRNNSCASIDAQLLSQSDVNAHWEAENRAIAQENLDLLAAAKERLQVTTTVLSTKSTSFLQQTSRLEQHSAGQKSLGAPRGREDAAKHVSVRELLKNAIRTTKAQIRDYKNRVKKKVYAKISSSAGQHQNNANEEKQLHEHEDLKERQERMQKAAEASTQIAGVTKAYHLTASADLTSRKNTSDERSKKRRAKIAEEKLQEDFQNFLKNVDDGAIEEDVEPGADEVDVDEVEAETSSSSSRGSASTSSGNDASSSANDALSTATASTSSSKSARAKASFEFDLEEEVNKRMANARRKNMIIKKQLQASSTSSSQQRKPHHWGLTLEEFAKRLSRDVLSGARDADGSEKKREDGIKGKDKMNSYSTKRRKQSVTRGSIREDHDSEHTTQNQADAGTEGVEQAAERTPSESFASRLETAILTRRASRAAASMREKAKTVSGAIRKATLESSRSLQAAERSIEAKSDDVIAAARERRRARSDHEMLEQSKIMLQRNLEKLAARVEPLSEEEFASLPLDLMHKRVETEEGRASGKEICVDPLLLSTHAQLLYANRRLNDRLESDSA